MGVDFVGVDFVGVDFVGVDLLGMNLHLVSCTYKHSHRLLVTSL